MMEIRTKRLGICATAITLIWTIVNYILGHTYGKIIGITDWGGDAKFTYGFGVVLTKLCPLRHEDDPVKTVIIVRISPMLFVLTVLVLWVLFYTLFWIVDKIKSKKAKTENISRGDE